MQSYLVFAPAIALFLLLSGCSVEKRYDVSLFDERIPLWDNTPVQIGGSAVANGKITKGQLLVYDKGLGYLWYRVQIDEGGPIGQLVEFYPDGKVKMVAYYERPGITRDQVYFFSNGAIDRR